METVYRVVWQQRSKKLGVSANHIIRGMRQDSFDKKNEIETKLKDYFSTKI